MKKRSIILIPILLILLSFNVSALITVALDSPTDNYTEVASNKIIFRCIAAGENLVNITLKLKSTAVWYSMGTKPSSNFVPTEFTISPLLNGDYEWNCVARDKTNKEFQAPKSSQLHINVTFNTPPRITKAIPDQTKNINADPWFIDLSSYKEDSEDSGDKLAWSISDVDNSLITINITKDIMTFTPKLDKYGSDEINIILTDSGSLTTSRKILLTINQKVEKENTAPKIKSSIADIDEINISIDEEEYELDLTEYESDEEDPAENLTWSISGIDEEVFEAELTDKAKDIITITPKDIGSDKVTLKLNDSKGLSDSEEITIRIIGNQTSEEETTTNEEELLEEENNEFAPVITSFSPSDSNIVLEKQVSKMYTIKKDDKDTFPEDLKVQWYLDDKELKGQTKDSYFMPYNTIKDSEEHTLTVKVSDQDSSTEHSWTITLKEETNKTALTNTTALNATFVSSEALSPKTDSEITGAATGILSKETFKSLPFIIIATILVVALVILIAKKSFKPKKPHVHFSKTKASLDDTITLGEAKLEKYGKPKEPSPANNKVLRDIFGNK